MDTRCAYGSYCAERNDHSFKVVAVLYGCLDIRRELTAYTGVAIRADKFHGSVLCHPNVYRRIYNASFLRSARLSEAFFVSRASGASKRHMRLNIGRSDIDLEVASFVPGLTALLLSGRFAEAFGRRLFITIR